MFVGVTLLAHLARHGLPLGQRFGEKSRLPGGAAHQAAKLLVGRVVQAERVTMRQQPALASKHQCARVAQQLGVAACHERVAHQKVAVAVHEKQRQALRRSVHDIDTPGFKIGA